MVGERDLHLVISLSELHHGEVWLFDMPRPTDAERLTFVAPTIDEAFDVYLTLLQAGTIRVENGVVVPNQSVTRPPSAADIDPRLAGFVRWPSRPGG